MLKLDVIKRNFFDPFKEINFEQIWASLKTE